MWVVSCLPTLSKSLVNIIAAYCRHNGGEFALCAKGDDGKTIYTLFDVYNDISLGAVKPFWLGSLPDHDWDNNFVCSADGAWLATVNVDTYRSSNPELGIIVQGPFNLGRPDGIGFLFLVSAPLRLLNRETGEVSEYTTHSQYTKSRNTRESRGSFSPPKLWFDSEAPLLHFQTARVHGGKIIWCISTVELHTGKLIQRDYATELEWDYNVSVRERHPRWRLAHRALKLAGEVCMGFAVQSERPDVLVTRDHRQALHPLIRGPPGSQNSGKTVWALTDLRDETIRYLVPESDVARKLHQQRVPASKLHTNALLPTWPHARVYLFSCVTADDPGRNIPDGY